MHLTYPVRLTAPHPWSPMTDAEWDALSTCLTTGRGRPPRNRRQIWDAIFWVACGTEPWAALPKSFGDYGTAHSALMYQARNGTLDRLLIAVSPHPFAPEAMRSLEWRILRAFRRAARQLDPYSLLLARNLGLESALPCAPHLLPTIPQDPPGMPHTFHRVLDMPRIPAAPCAASRRRGSTPQNCPSWSTRPRAARAIWSCAPSAASDRGGHFSPESRRIPFPINQQAPHRAPGPNPRRRPAQPRAGTHQYRE